MIISPRTRRRRNRIPGSIDPAVLTVGNVILNGLISYLDAADFTGSGTWTTRAPGIYSATNIGVSKSGPLAVWDGISDYLDFGRITELEGIGNNFTIQLWVKRVAGTTKIVWVYSSIAATSSFQGNNPDLYFASTDYHMTEGGGDSTVWLVGADTAWHNVAVVATGASIDVYGDGVFRTTISRTDAAGAGYKFFLGAGYTQGYWWNGNMDTILIYSRALSAAEVLANYINTPH